MAVYGGTSYIVCNASTAVLYIDVTSNLNLRITQHRDKNDVTSFTAHYNCWKLVYFENFPRIEEAIAREKQLKKWRRIWKMEQISSVNPNWRDLFEELQ